ncbi:MAG: phasin family protein [Alphaproteobacteria bacterium]|nr:phasin family protein [Alphaproteobacteria bacterium]
MAKSESKSRLNGLGASAVPPVDIEPLLEVNQRGIEAVAQANSHVLQNMARLNSEIFQFVSRRLEHDRKTAKEFAACSSPQEAYSVCGKFLESAMKQYSEEMGVITGLYTDQLRQTIEDTQHQLHEAVNSSVDAEKQSSS